MRDSAFDKQVATLAAERVVLTKQQWQTLQDQLQQRMERRGGRDRGGYPGRGGFPGRGGRRPSWPRSKEGAVYTQQASGKRLPPATCRQHSRRDRIGDRIVDEPEYQ